MNDEQMRTTQTSASTSS